MNQDMHTEEWVECPYCRRVIQAPNEPDVTFSCPDCGRELITYSKEEVNNALTVEVPTEIDKWNWGLSYLEHYGDFLMVYIGH